MTKPEPIIKTSDFRMINGQLSCNVEVFYPGITLNKLLTIYIGTDITKYLQGSSVQKIVYLEGALTDPEGKSRICYGFKMGANLPSIFDADLQQTAWDYGNGNGRILVSPLNGPLGGYIIVDLKEGTDKEGLPSVTARWNLEDINVRLCSQVHIATGISEEVISQIPILRNFSHFPTTILDLAGYVPLLLISKAVVYYALKIPYELLKLN